MEKMEKKNQVPEERIAEEKHELEIEELDLVSGGQNAQEGKAYDPNAPQDAPVQIDNPYQPVKEEKYEIPRPINQNSF